MRARGRIRFLPIRFVWAIRTQLLVSTTSALIAALPAVAVDVAPTNIEVTQSIQDLASTVRLVQGRETWVRAFASSDGPAAATTARLYGELGGPGGTPVGPLFPSNPLSGYTFLTTGADRADLSSSFQFSIPPAWQSGDLALRVVVDPDDELGESDETNNELEITVTFEAPLALEVAFFDYAHATSGPPRDVDLIYALSYLIRSMPGTRVDIRGTRAMALPSIDLGNDVCGCPKDAAGNCTSVGSCSNVVSLACTADTDCGCMLVNAFNGLTRAFDYLSYADSYGPARRYYGFVGDGGGTGFMRGCSPISGFVGSGPAGDPAPYELFAWDTDPSYADWYTAHELGHAWGQRHATCCGARSRSSTYPDPNCSMSSTGDATYYGFDVLDRTPLVPSMDQGEDGNYTEVMSYCPNQWPSDFTLEGVYQQITSDAAISVPSEGLEPEQYVVVTGSVNFDLPAAVLGTMHRISSRRVPYENVPGSWSIRFADANQNILGEHAFFPAPIEAGHPGDDPLPPGEPHETGLVTEILPYAPGTSVVELLENGVVLDTFVVSPNAPTVTLLAPNGGEFTNDKLLAQWSASDADNDPLTFMLLYSPDGGQSWNVVATGLTGNQLEVDLSEMPPSVDARLRVVANDGFNTAQDESDDDFAVADGPPGVLILTADETQYQLEERILLRGFAADAADGDLSDAIDWFSDVSGYLGTGAAIDAGTLPEGPHVITAQVGDALQQITSQMISIDVVNGMPPVPGLTPLLSVGGLMASLALAGLVSLRRAR